MAKDEKSMPKEKLTSTMEITNSSSQDRPQPFKHQRTTFVHLFIIALEVGLLWVQFSRMEVAAFDLSPNLADRDFGFFYGSHVFGALWLMMVVLVSYASWEYTIRLHQQGKSASGALRASVIFWWLANGAAMFVEFNLFHQLMGDASSLGMSGSAQLLSTLMVAIHQACSFWIMKNVIRQLFFPELDTDLPAAAALSEEETSSTADAGDATPHKLSSSTSY